MNERFCLATIEDRLVNLMQRIANISHPGIVNASINFTRAFAKGLDRIMPYSEVALLSIYK